MKIQLQSCKEAKEQSEGALLCASEPLLLFEMQIDNFEWRDK
jgi:hypothetical protein